MSNGAVKPVNVVAVSGLSWPTRSRGYLINLVREVVAKHKAQFAIVAGHTVDGKYLDSEFRARLKERIADEREACRETELRFNADWVRHEFEREFVEEYASQLSDFLPRLPNGTNWHFAIAERIYDRPIGAKILEKLRDMRADVRIIGKRQEDGFYDREPKFPIQMRGFEEIRVIVPHRSPWFSKVITNLVQRLHNAFAPRTLSPKPDLILTGVTGTATHLPYYDGVPTISVPALNKLVEQQATEHMIGATVVRIVPNGDEKPRIISGVHNFRTAAFEEKALAVPASLPNIQQAVMYALIPSDASFKAILYRVNARKDLFRRKTEFNEAAVKKAIGELVSAGKVVFSRRSNRYGINDELRRKAEISLKSLHEGSRTVKHVVWSCLHGGALKTLYFTFLKLIPRLGYDADALVENGDLRQGIAHLYEYNGELLPIANGEDKQDLINAHLRATVLLDIFRNRLSRMSRASRKDVDKVLETCLVPYVIGQGNHDKWGHHNKAALILQLFQERLRAVMVDGVMRISAELDAEVSYDAAKAAVDRKIIMVGESRMTELDGIVIAVKHPHKGRSIQKSTRIQEVTDFIWRRFDSYLGTVAKLAKGFSIAYVANFHEAAAAHVTKFGQTVLGVMTGAFLKDTSFESNIDKVVDHGPAVVTATFDAEGRLLYSETEYVNTIVPEDKVIVDADRLDSEVILEQCVKLMNRIGLKLPWR
jgi:hypothetical protein